MKKIALIVPKWGIGDLIFVLPLIRSIKKVYPKSHLTIFGSSNFYKDVLKNNPNVDELILLREFTHNKIERYFPFKSFFKLLKLRSKFYLSIVGSPHGYYGSFVSLILGAKKSISHKFNFFDRWFSDTIPFKKQIEIKQNLSLIDCISSKEYFSLPKIYLDKKELAFSKSFLGYKKNDVMIGFHPGCSTGAEFRQWSINKFIALAKKLSKDNKKVLFFLGPDEIHLYDKLKSLVKNKNIIIIKNMELRKTISLISKCQVFVSADSGPMHIAEGMNVPVVGIFGPTDFRRSGPSSKGSIIIRRKMKCSPCCKTLEQIQKTGIGKDVECVYGGKNRHRCISNISVKEVYDAVKKII